MNYGVPLGIRKGTLHVKLFKERIICTTHQKLSTILDRLEVKKKKISLDTCYYYGAKRDWLSDGGNEHG